MLDSQPRAPRLPRPRNPQPPPSAKQGGASPPRLAGGAPTTSPRNAFPSRQARGGHVRSRRRHPCARALPRLRQRRPAPPQPWTQGSPTRGARPTLSTTTMTTMTTTTPTTGLARAGMIPVSCVVVAAGCRVWAVAVDTMVSRRRRGGRGHGRRQGLLSTWRRRRAIALGAVRGGQRVEEGGQAGAGRRGFGQLFLTKRARHTLLPRCSPTRSLSAPPQPPQLPQPPHSPQLPQPPRQTQASLRSKGPQRPR